MWGTRRTGHQFISVTAMDTTVTHHGIIRTATKNKGAGVTGRFAHAPFQVPESAVSYPSRILQVDHKKMSCASIAVRSRFNHTKTLEVASARGFEGRSVMRLFKSAAIVGLFAVVVWMGFAAAPALAQHGGGHHHHGSSGYGGSGGYGGFHSGHGSGYGSYSSPSYSNSYAPSYHGSGYSSGYYGGQFTQPYGSGYGNYGAGYSGYHGSGYGGSCRY